MTTRETGNGFAGRGGCPSDEKRRKRALLFYGHWSGWGSPSHARGKTCFVAHAGFTGSAAGDQSKSNRPSPFYRGREENHKTSSVPHCETTEIDCNSHANHGYRFENVAFWRKLIRAGHSVIKYIGVLSTSAGGQ